MSTPERHVGRYTIVRQIGRGGMATVYLARQQTLDRDVALKELSSFHASAPDMAQRFLQESRLAGSLNHPNIVTVLEYFEDDGVPYIAMEYVRRGSLRPYVGRLATAQFVGVMEGVLAGLAHAETHGIVHRDLKPENIMVTADGRVKITDFGIAKATQAAGTGVFLTAAGTTVGTPTYMAPEQAMGQDIGIWTDLYSVGIMAWEHVVGRVPFYDSEVPMVILTRQLNEAIPPAVSINPGIDQDLSDWIDRLLVKNPRDRAQSPVTVWDDLEEIIISMLGPRWRREGRLPSPSQVFDTPHDLTPAPFESQMVSTPAPAAAPPEDRVATPPADGVATPPEAPAVTPPGAPAATPAGAPAVTPPGTPAVTPPEAPAVTPPEQPAAPKPETGYVTFGAAAAGAVAPLAAEAAEQAAAPPGPVTPPAQEAAGPVTPLGQEAAVPTPQASALPEDPAAPPEELAAPPKTPAEVPHEPTYVTYGRAPGAIAPVTPEPVAPEEPVEAAPTEEPVAADPVIEGETLPGMGQLAAAAPALEPVAEHEVAEHEGVEAEPEGQLAEPAPQVVELEPPPPEPEPAVEPEPARPEPVRPARPEVAVRRRAVIAAAVAVAVAAGIGFAIAPKSGGGSTTTPTQLTSSASSGPISVSFPAGWQRQSSTPPPPGLQLNNQIVLVPSPPGGGMLVIGNATTTDPSLLPKTFLTALPGGAPKPQVVTLGGSQFYRYLSITPAGANGPVSVYALPTTTAGTVLAACVLHGAAATFPSDCERVLASLRLQGTRPAGLGPSNTFATELSGVLSKLNTAVTTGQARLHSAGKPAQQATAAGRLSTAYDQAAAAIQKLNPGPAAGGAVAALAAALAKTGHDYATLSHAAARNDKHGYTAATSAIGTDSGSVTAAFDQLSKLGYAS